MQKKSLAGPGGVPDAKGFRVLPLLSRWPFRITLNLQHAGKSRPIHENNKPVVSANSQDTV